MLDCNLRDQTVIAATRRFSRSPAILIKTGGGNVRFHWISGYVAEEIRKVRSPRFESLGRVRPLQNLLQNDRRGTDDLFAGKQITQCPNLRRCVTAQVVHPN